MLNMPIQENVLFIGKTGSGKTHAIQTMLAHRSENDDAKVVVVLPDPIFTHAYSGLHVDQFATCIEEIQQVVHDLCALFEQRKKEPSPQSPIYLIVDNASMVLDSVSETCLTELKMLIRQGHRQSIYVIMASQPFPQELEWMNQGFWIVNLDRMPPHEYVHQILQGVRRLH